MAMIKHAVELIPLKLFTEHFSENYIWQRTFEQDSAFKKLLMTPDLISVQNYEKFEFARLNQNDWNDPLTIGSTD